MSFPELGIMCTFYALALVSSFQTWLNVIIPTLPLHRGWDLVNDTTTTTIVVVTEEEGVMEEEVEDKEKQLKDENDNGNGNDTNNTVVVVVFPTNTPTIHSPINAPTDGTTTTTHL